MFEKKIKRGASKVLQRQALNENCKEVPTGKRQGRRVGNTEEKCGSYSEGPHTHFPGKQEIPRGEKKDKIANSIR